MTLEAAEVLVSKRPYNEDDKTGLCLYKGYSGRFMFGAETDGLTGSWGDFLDAIAEVLREGEEYEQDAVADALEHLRWDDMGRDMIFY